MEDIWNKGTWIDFSYKLKPTSVFLYFAWINMISVLILFNWGEKYLFNMKTLY